MTTSPTPTHRPGASHLAAPRSRAGGEGGSAHRPGARSKRIYVTKRVVALVLAVGLLTYFIVQLASGGSGPSPSTVDPMAIVRAQDAALGQYAATFDADIAKAEPVAAGWAASAWCASLAAGGETGAIKASLQSLYARDVPAGGLATGIGAVTAALGRKGFADLSSLIGDVRVSESFCTTDVGVAGLYQGGGALGDQFSRLVGTHGGFIYTVPVGIEFSYRLSSGGTGEHVFLVEMVSVGNQYGALKIERVGPIIAFAEKSGSVSAPVWITEALGIDTDGIALVNAPTRTQFAQGVSTSPVGQGAQAQPGSIALPSPYQAHTLPPNPSTPTKAKSRKAAASK